MASPIHDAPTAAIRPATEADAPGIKALVSQARLNPRDLDWHRFLVADEAGMVVACAQVRVHAAGSRELASVVVRPDRRGTGIGRAISEAAIAREAVRPLYLYTELRTQAFWTGLGFRVMDGDEIPRDLRGSLRVARVLTRLASLLSRRTYRIVVMRRDDF